MTITLNTDNREYMTWQFEQLNFGLLGGLKIEGLERMRVTVKVEYKQQAVRHNLDLYNNDSLDKLVRRCAERFSLGTAYLATAFAGLINELEAYRLEQLKQLAEEKLPVKQITVIERQQAEAFLKQPDLLIRTNDLIGQSGVIGEEKIMHYQRLKSAGKINTQGQQQVKQLLQNVQRVLQPVTVRNPYAELLQLPPCVFKPRRTNAHYLAFIEVITFYHQYQRVQKTDQSTGEVYIETLVEDIKAANQLMSEVLLRKSDELPGACRNYYECFKLHVSQQLKDSFTNRVISKELHIPLSTVKRHNFMLHQTGYLTRHPGGDDSKGFTYALSDQEEYQQMKNNITTVLDTILNNIQANHQQPTNLHKFYQFMSTWNKPDHS